MTNILVVDDDRDICELLESKLTSHGYTVDVEHDGEAALAAIEELKVDLLVLDWMMPRMGGVEVCLALRADDATVDLPILLITARAQQADVQRGLRAGADAVIFKPFSPSEVAASVASMLARFPRNRS